MITNNFNKLLFYPQKFQESLPSNGRDAKELESTVLLLQHTSQVISFFTDKLPISTMYDSRLRKLYSFLGFLNMWREETAEHNKHFISSKLWFDLQSMCLGFQAMISIKLKRFPHSMIKPAIVNQDCVENHFCQVRACNGQNNNPTYHKQESTQNSIRFGQTTVSAKSNAGLKRDIEKGLKSCSIYKPTVKKRKVKEKKDDKPTVL